MSNALAHVSRAAADCVVGEEGATIGVASGNEDDAMVDKDRQAGKHRGLAAASL